jgi:hypothetical protein
MAGCIAMFSAMAGAQQPLWSELALCLVVATRWTYGNYARNAAALAAVGQTALPTHPGPPLAARVLWIAYWASRFLMWTGFVGLACFTARAVVGAL